MSIDLTVLFSVHPGFSLICIDSTVFVPLQVDKIKIIICITIYLSYRGPPHIISRGHEPKVEDDICCRRKTRKPDLF